jgi:hypothetical protein
MMETQKYSLRDEQFRWQRQKFMLVYTSGFMLAFASLWLGYMTFSHGDFFRVYAEKEIGDLVQRQRTETLMLGARVEELAAKLNSTEALVKRLEENQQAQAAVIQKLSPPQSKP